MPTARKTPAGPSEAVPATVKRNTRAAPASTSTTTSRTRTRPAPATSAEKHGSDDLVHGMERLSVKPKPKPNPKPNAVATAPARPARSAAASTSASASASTSTASRSAHASSSRPTSTLTKATTTITTTSKSTAPKGKGKEKEKEELIPLALSLPWADSSGELKPAERSKLAMQAVNASVRSLSAAVQSGYRYGSTNTNTNTDSSSTPSSTSVPATSGLSREREIWTDSSVLALIQTCEVALRVLRGLDADGQLGGKGIEVEKACQGIVVKCLSLGMYRRALDTLVEARPSILKLYLHSNSTSSAAPLPSEPPRTAQTTSRATSRTTSKPSVTSRTTASSSSSRPAQSPPTVSPEYVQLTQWPCPNDGSELSDTVRGLVFSSLMASWVALVVITKGGDEVLPHLPLPPSSSVSSQTLSLHPFDLALSIPRPQTTPILHLFYRQVSSLSLPPTSSAFLHLRILALISLALTISSSPECKNTPSQLWDTVHRALASFINADEGKTKVHEAAKAVETVVNFVELMLERLGESKSAWFAGKGWYGLTELWVGLGRRLNDSAVIARALSLMTSSTSITNPSSATPPSITTPTSSRTPEPSNAFVMPQATPTKPTRKKIVDPEAEIARICADLAKLNLAIEQVLNNPSDDRARSIQQYSSVDELSTLGRAVVDLPQDEGTIAVIGKAVRAIERVRRGNVKLLDRSSGSSELTALGKPIETWLDEGIQTAEMMLTATSSDRALSQDLVSGALDSALSLIQRDPSSSLSYLNRSRTILDKVSIIAKSSDQADCLRCLASAAYNNGAKLYKDGKMEDAAPFVKMSCDWSTEALGLLDSAQGGTSPSAPPATWQQVREAMPRRWELSAAIYQKMGHQQGLYKAYASCFASQPQAIIDRLAKGAALQPIAQAFEGNADLLNSITRLAQIINFDPAGAISLGDNILEKMRSAKVDDGFFGAVLEQLTVVLEDGASRSEIAQITLGLCEAALTIYAAESHTVRRTRVITRMLGVIVQSGQAKDRFEALAAEIEDLSACTDLGEDQALSAYRKEYESTALILRSLQVYHTSPEPASGVRGTSKRAVQALRAIVLPPTAHGSSPSRPTAIPPGTKVSAETARKKIPLGKSTTTKAVSARPARGTTRTVSEPKGGVKKGVAAGKNGTVKDTTAATKRRRSSVFPALVFDDLKRLTRLLGSLADLLGLLGHDLQKVEVLKLLRAFQRNREDLLDDYIQRSAQLASDYQKLGKSSRAGFVFAQALRTVTESKREASLAVRVELQLRYCIYLANVGNVNTASRAYEDARLLNQHVVPIKNGSLQVRVIDRCATLERAALARSAMAAMTASQDNASAAISHLCASFRLWTRSSEAICRIAAQPAEDAPSTSSTSTTKSTALEDPFSAPSKPKPPAPGAGADEPPKDAQVPLPSQISQFSGKHLSSLQWHVASSFLDTSLELANAYAHRGSVKDCEYFLKQARVVAGIVKSGGVLARVGAREAEIKFRLRLYEEVEERLQGAAESLDSPEGPDAIDLKRVQGDLYSRQEMVEEAGELFVIASREIAGLDAAFVATEATLPTPKKNALLSASTSSGRASLGQAATPRKSLGANEPLLPVALAHVLRQHAWLLREAGSKEECEQLLGQIKLLPSTTETKAEELLLEGRIALHEAFNTFKTDLFMSSLTESAVAMPMGNTEKRVVDRQSTRLSIQTVLHRAEEAYLSALSLVASSGKVEGIRQACLALALLRAFQTSLGHGSEEITASAAGVLASSSAITLHRELLEAIEGKFTSIGDDDLTWPSLARFHTAPTHVHHEDEDDDTPMNLDDHDGKLRTYWDTIRTKYLSTTFASPPSDALDTLPANWAVISINVTDDHNTMFISRHQRNHEPIVFCLPLDRQGRREGEDDIFTFDIALAELEDIIECSNEGARSTKNVSTQEGKLAWWAQRHALDKRMEELCVNIEYVWLGAFKTILSSRDRCHPPNIADFRTRLEKIFQSALSGSNTKAKTSAQMNDIHLNDALLECFASLSSKCKDEEVEDLVYFILDIYQFHGVPVALSELDIDQISIDVKGVLEKIEAARFKTTTIPTSNPTSTEHIFLALDKNVQSFPWESIPILRGRPVSRIPSLSFLLDQVSMGAHLRPSLSQTVVGKEEVDERRTVNSRRTFYILNPSGDLKRTQTHFEGWLQEMVDKAGWKGIVGRSPTELEMAAALKDYDLVLYIGHGGAEQYIRSHKIRHLPQCATTMLWGCSSGLLKDQGDFDRTGTPWHYMLAGCPSLTANLWDVTDRDIDRLSEAVLKKLHLDTSHLPNSRSRTNTFLPLSEMSTVQAVNAARGECKLKYLTGAAPVVYGLPVWLH